MRKLANYTVTEDGRDKGKVFLITEMSNTAGEAWAMRVLLALMNSNVNLPENFAELGMAGLAELGIRALGGLKWEDAEPLLNEMMQGIQIIVDPSKPHVVRPIEADYDIEEIMTRLNLRMEVWNLNMGFLQAVAHSVSPAKRVTASNARVTKTSAR